LPVAFAVIFALSGAVGRSSGRILAAGDSGSAVQTDHAAGVQAFRVVDRAISAAAVLRSAAPLAAMFDAKALRDR